MSVPSLFPPEPEKLKGKSKPTKLQIKQLLSFRDRADRPFLFNVM
jgi:hypothetical protein